MKICRFQNNSSPKYGCTWCPYKMEANATIASSEYLERLETQANLKGISWSVIALEYIRARSSMYSYKLDEMNAVTVISQIKDS